MPESASSRSDSTSPTARLTLPLSCATAALRLCCAAALTTSITASACERSILPLTKARRVNSPASAGRKPQPESSASTRCTVQLPPWQWISAMGSPV